MPPASKGRRLFDGSTFQIGQPPGRIDILPWIDGIEFEACRIEDNIDGKVQAFVIFTDDLIRNKLASGRERGLLDVKIPRTADRTLGRESSI